MFNSTCQQGSVFSRGYTNSHPHMMGYDRELPGDFTQMAYRAAVWASRTDDCLGLRVEEARNH